MKSVAALFAPALACFSLAACNSQLAQSVSLGSAAANARLAGVAAKIDAGLAVVQSDIPTLCALAGDAATIGQAAATLANPSPLTKAANGAAAAVASPLCAQGLTGSAADAAVLAASIKAIAAATNTPASAIATVK